MKARLMKKRYKANLMAIALKLPAVLPSAAHRRVFVNAVAAKWQKERRQCRSARRDNTWR